MPGQAIASINESQWSASIASTYTELTTGLRGVSALTAGTGMLFILPTTQAPAVDTTGMNFPLDIIFIANNIVLDVARNIQPGYLVTEETPCDMFLEVNAGEAADVEAGDAVSVTSYSGPAAFDLTAITSFAIPLVVLGFVCGMAGGMASLAGSSSSSHSSQRRLGEPKAEAERREAHERKYGTRELPERGRGLKERGEYGACYEDAWRFLLKEQEGELIHGSVQTIGKRINHAWVELPTGFVWEPESEEFMKKSYFYERAEPQVQDRYTAEEAAIMAARTGNLGPWTEEEKRQILSQEHHSMWLTLEQRKELEKKYGMVAVRWAEEATKPGDIKAAERAAEYYYGKVREALGLGHLSPKLSEEQIMKLREVLGLPVDIAEILKIHQETGYIS